jgi:cell division protein ZapA
MAKLSLKVVVAGRTYPLSVEENEVEKVQAAAENINKAIKVLQDNYAVKDMRDLLAMSALQLASKSKGKVEIKSDSGESLKEVENQLKSLSNDLDALK